MLLPGVSHGAGAGSPGMESSHIEPDVPWPRGDDILPRRKYRRMLSAFHPLCPKCGADLVASTPEELKPCCKDATVKTVVRRIKGRI